MKLSAFPICAILFTLSGAASALPAASTHSGFTPEERFLYMRQQHGAQWRDLSVNERCERKQQMRQERLQMTPAAFQQLKQKLDAEWQSLPAADKQRIERRIADSEERREQGQNQPHPRHCAGI
jgi:Skp family chaperone for outer membrane proteins